MGLNRYIKEVTTKFIPHNEVELAYSHLSDEGNEEINDYNDLVDKFSLLGNIHSDRLMNIYMHQLHLFNAILPFTKKSKTVKLILNNLFHRWKSEVAMSRAYDGVERKLQANAARPQYLSGYGSQYDVQEEDTTKKSKKNNFFDMIIPSKK